MNNFRHNVLTFATGFIASLLIMAGVASSWLLMSAI